MLKPNRIVTEQDLSFYMDEVAEAGIAAVVKSVGTGVSMDDVDHQVEVSSTVANKVVAGFLMQDVVDKDLTKHHLNFHNGEVNKGSKVTLLTKGQITTDQVDGAVTASGPAYLAANGKVSATQATNAPRVGTFLTAKDDDGFVRLSVSL